jgi:hypothetical protein
MCGQLGQAHVCSKKPLQVKGLASAAEISVGNKTSSARSELPPVAVNAAPKVEASISSVAQIQ